MFKLNSTRLQIRETTAGDLPALLPVYTSNPEFVQQNEGSEGEIGQYDLDRWQRDWQIAQMMPGSHWLGCYLQVDGAPVGVVQFLEENEADGKPWLGSLIIHKTHQRQGLGAEIFQCLIERFRQHMCWTTLRAGIQAQNEAGLAFARQMGFQMVKEGSARFASGMQQFFIMEFML